MLNKITLAISESAYKNVLKPILFRINPEKVHEGMTGFGELLGKSAYAKKIFGQYLKRDYSSLQQKIEGNFFASPVGLSAGFDYNGRLTQIIPAMGFGFHTIGTITRHKYKGNPSPILGRLPRSKSLMVNKGFKNRGVEQIIHTLENDSFVIPVGISIGRTNSLQLTTHTECIGDIISSFIICEHSNVKHAYYELNISCPNLVTQVSFYDPQKLDILLRQLDFLSLSRPLYIKMPIECDNELILNQLEIIQKHRVQGVIFGNLQKNRNDPSFDQREVVNFPKGNFSGKPTENRSNELIQLVYKQYAGRLTIIGTGGVFSAEDAYKKIKLGASLIQLITGMIFQGPQLIAQINEGLVCLLKKDGYTHISQAIGAESR